MDSQRGRSETVHVAPLPCMCASLRRAARAVTQLYEADLRAVGVRATQLTILQVLHSQERITQGRLGALLGLDSTTLSRTLRLLERRGWIRSWPGDDRRERRLALTPAGSGQMERALPIWERAQKRLRTRLGATEWERLLTGLVRATGTAQGS